MAWLATSTSKRYGETAVLIYTPLWMLCLAVIVKTRWYEAFTTHDYIGVGVAFVTPIVLLPLLMATGKERALPIHKRYIVKANVYIAILGYIGNHFYTHYFNNVLGMRYTGPLAEGVQINKVPLSMFLMTHTYFLSYHILIGILLRLVRRVLEWSHVAQLLGTAVAVALLAIGTAAAETWTISSFPYYTYPDYHTMITIGSVFYGLFFVITFPMFHRLDEDHSTPWTLGRTAIEALAAMMLVLLCADWWRLLIGAVYTSTDAEN